LFWLFELDLRAYISSQLVRMSALSFAFFALTILLGEWIFCGICDGRKL
jgi:hypothetical protein